MPGTSPSAELCAGERAGYGSSSPRQGDEHFGSTSKRLQRLPHQLMAEIEDQVSGKSSNGLRWLRPKPLDTMVYLNPYLAARMR